MVTKIMVWVQNHYTWLNLGIFTLAWIYITFIAVDDANRGGMVAFNSHDMLVVLSLFFIVLSAIAAFLQLKFSWALMMSYGIAVAGLIAHGLCLMSSRSYRSYLLTLIFCICLNSILSLMSYFKAGR